MVTIKSNKLTGGAICTALSVLFLFLGDFLPLKIALLFITSVVVGVGIFKYKTSVAVLTYFASSILSLFLVQNKLLVFAYILVFGCYPIIKLYIEKIKKIVAEYVLKALLWSLTLYLGYIVFCALGHSDLLNESYLLYVIIGYASLFAYDLVFGMFMNGMLRTYKKFFN